MVSPIALLTDTDVGVTFGLACAVITWRRGAGVRQRLCALPGTFTLWTRHLYVARLTRETCNRKKGSREISISVRLCLFPKPSEEEERIVVVFPHLGLWLLRWPYSGQSHQTPQIQARKLILKMPMSHLCSINTGFVFGQVEKPYLKHMKHNCFYDSQHLIDVR